VGKRCVASRVIVDPSRLAAQIVHIEGTTTYVRAEIETGSIVLGRPSKTTRDRDATRSRQQ